MMKKICFVAFLIMLRFGLYAQTVTFSHSGGFYENSFNLELSCDGSYHIRYTFDGNRPTANSRLYEAPLTLNASLYSNANIYQIQISPDDLAYVPDSVSHCIVIRAAAFDANDIRVSETVTNTYLIQELGCENHGIAVVSVCADSLDLFDYNTGIFVRGVNWDSSNPNHTGNYYQHGIEWERWANVEFYEPADNSGINQQCGIRTHGNRSRRQPAKGMKIYARDEYGKKRFKHQFFDDTPMNSFNHLVLKPFASFWPFSGVQDYFGNRVAQHLDLDAPHCRHVLLYLNGEFWGIYFIQEKTDEDFLEDHHGVYPENCNIIGNWAGSVDHGSNTNFKQMMHWFENADLTNDSNYDYACRMIDMSNFIDYYVFQTFIGNWDWPGNNMRCWQDGNGPWRWIFFDGDASIIAPDFEVFENAAVYEPPTTWINYPEAKLVFGKLLKNERFKQRFTARARELCSGLFMYENTYPVVHDLLETLRPKIAEQGHRFSYPESVYAWDNGNSQIYDFLEHRAVGYIHMMENSPLLDVEDVFFGDNNFICYPNPSDGTIYINIIDNQLNTYDIRVYDIVGTLVYEKPASMSLSLDLPAGMYIVKIGNSTQKIIIQ